MQILKDDKLDPDLTLHDIAKCTEGYSGSDLKELCRNAAFVPVQELIRSHKGAIETLDMKNFEKRALKFSDFFPKDGKSDSGMIHGADGTLTGKLDLD